jgi:EmrB/QacA subfamily drug resistance transporter
MAFLDSTVVNVALPHLGRGLHASLAGLQWTVNAYTLTLASLVLLGGALGDRYGHRRLFLLGVVWFALASAACGAAQSVGMLVAARTVQGIGAALLTPNSLALVQSSFDPRDRARAIGAWSGLSGVSTAVGPFVGGWLVDALSWRWIFFLNLPFAVVALLLGLRWVPDDRPERAGRSAFDVVGAVLAASGLVGISYALTQRGREGLAAAVVAVLAIAGCVWQERRLGDRAMLPPRLFASRSFTTLCLATLVVYAGLSGLFFFLVMQLQVVSGFPAWQAGLAAVPTTVLLLAGSTWAGAVAGRIGARPLLMAGPLVAATGPILLLRVGTQASYLTDVLPGVVLFGLGMVMVVAPVTAATLAAAPEDLSGAASGVSNAVARTGGLLAVAGLPLLIGLSGGQYAHPAALDPAFRRAMLYCSGLLVLGAAVAGLLPRGGGAPARPVAEPVSSG